MALSEKTISLILSLDDAEFAARIDKAPGRFKQLEEASTSAGRSVNISGGILSAFGGVVSGIAVGTLARDLVEAGMAAERMRNAMASATGSLTQGAAEMDFVRSEANRLGLDLQKAASDYARLTASAQGTALQGEETRRIFSAVSEASVALGLSAEETSGALTAIQQMISKGTVSAEELRGQLGERLPGAFNVAARAMGVTTAELGKMLEKGQVTSADFLPKFATELPRAFKASSDSLDSAQANANRFKTALFDLKVSIMEQGGLESFKDLAKGATWIVDKLQEMVRWVREATVYWGALFDKWGAWNDAGGMLGMLKQENRDKYAQALKHIEQAEIESLLEIAAYADRRANRSIGAPMQPGAAGGSGGGKSGRPSWATSPTNKTFFGQAWDRAADELAYEDAQAFVLKVNDLGAGFKLGQETISLLGPVDLLSSYGRTEMTPAEQAQFDAAASQAEWETQQIASRERELMAEQQFYAEKAMLQGSSTEMELLRIQEEENRWLESWAMQATTMEEYENRKSQIEALSAAKRKKIALDENQYKYQAANNYSNAFMNLTNAMFVFSQGKSKELFYLNKAAGIANAIVSTYTGAALALDDLPYPFNLAAAASVIAMGMAQVAQISSTEFGDSGGGGGGVSAPAGGFGAGTPSSPVITQPLPQSQGGQQINIVINNPIGERRWFEENLPDILKDFRSRNVDVGVTYA